MPQSVRMPDSLRLPEALKRSRCLGQTQGHRRQKPYQPKIYRPRLLPHPPAECDSAQCAGKSGLVHRLHTYQTKVSQASADIRRFQQVCIDYTGFELANATLLDKPPPLPKP